MNAINKNDWELEPFVRVGPFKLGSEVTPELSKEHNLEMWPIESNTQETWLFWV